MVTKELETQTDLEKRAAIQTFPVCDPNHVHESLLTPLCQLLAKDETLNNSFTTYKVDLNNRASTWNKLDTETDPRVLAALLLEWLEHLKSPILDRNGITYVVIHCDNVEAALAKLHGHVGYIIEYLIRYLFYLLHY